MVNMYIPDSNYLAETSVDSTADPNLKYRLVLCIRKGDKMLICIVTESVKRSLVFM